MQKILEDYLWSRMRTGDQFDEYHTTPREIIKDMLNLGMIKSPKQVHATLDKWIRKGIYEYGCNLELGWKCEPRDFMLK